MLHYLIELIIWMLLAFFVGAVLACILRRLFWGCAPAERGGETPSTTRADTTTPPTGSATAGTEATGETTAGTGTVTTAGEEGATASAESEETAVAPSAETPVTETVAKEAAEEKAAVPEEKPEATATGAGAAGKAPATGEGREEASADDTGTTVQPLAAGAAADEGGKRATEAPAAAGSGEESAGGKAAGAAEAAEALPPFGLTSPVGGEPDNLTEIRGIGKKIEQTLHDLGVYHFRQIAAWTEKDIAEVDEKLRFRGRIVREKWVEQAKVLAEGGETDFARRVKEGDVPTSRKS